jgi:uncharacterized protein (TIGR03382 family)
MLGLGLLATTLAAAAAPQGSSYGVPVDGYPSAEERALVLWTNAARVAPEEFVRDYKQAYHPCTLDDFEASERSPKNPLYIDLALTEVARFHSKDMAENGCFQHESCDGTDTWSRIGRYYDESSYLGENIAMGTSDPYYAVFQMWMCSDGHRANIMNGDYNEMGGGIRGSYMTQDFAAGTLREGAPPVRVAAEASGMFYADWADAERPERLELVVDGKSTAFDLEHGESDRGVYVADPSLDGTCLPWRVDWETGGGDAGSFPASGSFLHNCDDEYTTEGSGGAGDDGGGGFFGFGIGGGDGGPGDHDDDDDDDDGLRLRGCASLGRGAPGFAAVLAAALSASRRRR